jgi:hypothetical protein
VLAKYNSSERRKELNDMKREIIILEYRRKELEIELTYLTSPQRLLELAKKYPKILENKVEITAKNIKTKKQVVKIAENKELKKTRFAKGVGGNGVF